MEKILFILILLCSFSQLGFGSENDSLEELKDITELGGVAVKSHYKRDIIDSDTPETISTTPSLTWLKSWGG